MKRRNVWRKVLAAGLAVSMLAGCGTAEGAADPNARTADASVTETRESGAEKNADGEEERADTVRENGAERNPGGRGTESDTEPEGDTVTADETNMLAHRLAAVPERIFTLYPDDDLLAGEGGWEEYSKVFDAWWAARAERQKYYDNNVGALYHYYRTAVPVFLRDDGESNAVCSPLNIYLALALLAETTDGQTREQIVQVLEGGAGKEDILRTDDSGDALTSWEWRASQLMEANFVDDGIVTSRIGNSLWLRDGGSYRADTVRKLAERFGAETFSGDMADGEYSRALQTWLDLRTGGLLSRQAAGVSFDSATEFALASTLYYKANWTEAFDKGATTAEVFHAPSGDRTVDMMHGGESFNYLRGDGFTMTSLDLMYSGRMFLFLPDEGVTPGELLDDERVLAEICGMTTADRKGQAVRVSLPKFDVTESFDLTDGMRALGITDVFDADSADFSLVTERDDLALSMAVHAARVVADEEGVLGAAYTVMMTEGAALEPEEPVELVFDRPFLFAVTAEDGSVLFMGVVNQA